MNKLKFINDFKKVVAKISSEINPPVISYEHEIPTLGDPKKLEKGIFKYTSVGFKKENKQEVDFKGYFSNEYSVIENPHLLKFADKYNELYDGDISLFIQHLGSTIEMIFFQLEKKKFNMQEIHPFTVELYNSLVKKQSISMAKYSLVNFCSNLDTIELDSKVRIEKVGIVDREKFYKKIKTWQNSSSVLLNEYYLILEYDDFKSLSFEDQSFQFQDNFLQFLRVFQHGMIDINFFQRFHKHGEDGSYHSLGLIMNPTQYPSGGTEYIINEENVNEFKKFWSRFKHIDWEKKSPLRIAVKRFNSSFLRCEFEDKLIDLMVAYEALFTKNNERSISRNMPKRVSSLINGEDFMIEDVQKFIKKCYKLRCSLVHGEAITINPSMRYQYLENENRIETLQKILRHYFHLYLVNHQNNDISHFIEYLDRTNTS